MINERTKQLRNYINKYLRKVGIRIDFIGFKYLSIMLSTKINENFKCTFYEDVAKMCKTRALRVERAIRYIATIQQEELKRHFQIEYKITNKVLFELLRNELIEQLYEFNMKQGILSK